MSEIRVNKLLDEAGTGAIELTEGATLPSGKTLSGSGTISMNVTGDVTGNATGLTGSPNITVNNVVGAAATFSGAVSVGGTLTYQDVTNVDSVGIVTAGGGLVTQKMLNEEVNVTAGKLSDNLNIYLEDGCIHHFTTAESTTSTPAIKYNASTNLKDRMSVGQSVVVTIITTANASAWSEHITIDGDAVTENWIGGSAPSDGGSSGVDIHTFTIIKTASATFTVIGNHSKTS